MQLIALIAFFVATTAATPVHRRLAASNRFQQIIVFGDSISDGGLPFGAWGYTNGTSPPATPQGPQGPQGSWRGRWSNGPVWADYVSKWTKKPVTSFAVGGATAQNIPGHATWDSWGVKIPILSLQDEIKVFETWLATNPKANTRGSVCVVHT